mmetsp:Transcript_41582/g.120523  ORF Transcript_41582/g.120523 Transcript_41582/m.120523 type:complete len:357 (+) Transcript_41582:101-1171(+)
MASWGTTSRRPDIKVIEIIDKFFQTRLWDTGECTGCKKAAPGIFGPDGCTYFYCRSCWIKYLKDTKDAEWKEWEQWTPKPRACITENLRQHELKCVLLALARTGGSISFLPTLTGYERLKVHEFCEKEPELKELHTKSFGKEQQRFLRVSSVSDERCLDEARAILEGPQAAGCEPADADVNGLAAPMGGLSMSANPAGSSSPAQAEQSLAQSLQGLKDGTLLRDVDLLGLQELQSELAIAQRRIAQEIEARFGQDVDDGRKVINPETTTKAAPTRNDIGEKEGGTTRDERKDKAGELRSETGAQKSAGKQDAKTPAPASREQAQVAPMQDNSDFPSLGAFPALGAGGQGKKQGKRK